MFRILVALPELRARARRRFWKSTQWERSWEGKSVDLLGFILMYIRGGFSIVKKGTNKETNEAFAIKIIEKTAGEEELQLLQREIDIMKKLKHKNIISLEDVYDEPDYIYLVMELHVDSYQLDG